MKTKLFILLIPALIFAFSSFGQAANDSLRTRNDRPGTPQSLRTPDQSPQSHVTILNANVPPNQNVIHTSSESTTPNNTNGKIIITTPNTNGNAVPKTPITLKTDPLGDTTRKVLNSGNPIRN